MGNNLQPRHQAPAISEADKQLGLVYPTEVLEGYKNDHEVFMDMKRLHLDAAKLAYEYLGEDYLETDNEIIYENSVYTDGLSVVINRTVDWALADFSIIGDPRNAEEAVDAFILFFRHEIGVQDYVIAGMMGCIAHESNFKSHIVAIGEKYTSGLFGRISHACGPDYGVGLYAFTFLNGFKGDCQKAIAPAGTGWEGWGYCLEAQPMNVQMQLAFASGTGDKFRSLIECVQNNLPWKPDIRELIKKRLKDLKEITPDQETGYNQYWERKELSELEELAVNQACDCWSYCGEHGSYSFGEYLSLRNVMISSSMFYDKDHTRKRRESAIMYYKYMKHMISNPGDA